MLFWLHVYESFKPAWLEPLLLVAAALFALAVLVACAGTRRGLTVWAAILVAVLFSSCKVAEGIGKYLGQYDREYSLQVFNAEGAGVKGAIKLSRKPAK